MILRFEAPKSLICSFFPKINTVFPNCYVLGIVLLILTSESRCQHEPGCCFEVHVYYKLSYLCYTLMCYYLF